MVGQRKMSWKDYPGFDLNWVWKACKSLPAARTLKDWLTAENENRGDRGFFAQFVMRIPLVRAAFIVTKQP